MSAPRDTQNVIGFQSRQPSGAAAARATEILRRVRDLALTRVDRLVQTLFENVDDALFDLAERAGSNALQTEYFDGMREVRKKRQLVERRFHDNAARAFAEFAEGRLKIARPELSAHDPADGLSLVDEADLEESLAVSSMVAKAENRLTRALHPLNLRLAAIGHGEPVGDGSNPAGPAVLGDAFRGAIGEFAVDVQVKLIVYKLFDRYVMGGLEPVYDEINAALIGAGVLPHIRATPGTHRGVSADAALMTHAVAMPNAMESSGATTTTAADGNGGGIALEIYHTLRSLLSRRHESASSAAVENNAIGSGSSYAHASSSMAPSLSPTDLLSALSILQNRKPTVDDAPDAIDNLALDARDVKRALLAQVRQLSHDARDRRVSSTDEDTIDLVGMLFEYILEDRNLPAQLQAQLGRLQIPYLKVAFLDKHLFAQKAHPARRLLDTLAEAGKGWSEESDRDHRLYDRIRASVEAVLRDFDDDIGVFNRETTAFNDFIEQHVKRSQLAEQRAAEATRGREKLDYARQTAAREIIKRIGERELAPIVHTVLARPWSNYLVLTLLRQGEHSEEWRDALRFADEFVWSAQTKSGVNDITRLRALLPQLEKSLRHGLATIACHDSDTRQLMQELSTFYRHVLAGDDVQGKAVRDVVATDASSAPAPVAGGATTPPTPVEALLAAALEPTVSIIEAAQESAADTAFGRQVRDLKVGTWIEFVGADDQRERAKLSWISPISSKYLFVNRRGLKVCDKTIAELAGLIASGGAIVLEEVPLFDRALDAIVARLRAANAEVNPSAASPNEIGTLPATTPR